LEKAKQRKVVAMPKLKCGFAQREITPARPGSVFLDGYGFRLTPAEGVRDPLYVKACALECGGDRFVIFSFDLCGMSPAVYDYVAGHIEEMTGMRRERFALACTHTHAGPACGVLDGLPINWDWLASVASAAADAAEEAFSTAAAGRFKTAVCGEFTLSHNRRGREPIDRRIRAAVFVAEDGTVRGIIANLACHPVTNKSMNISADYPSVLTEQAKIRFPGVPAIFLCGRGADINPSPSAGQSFEEQLLALGGELSGSVLSYAGTVQGWEGKASDTRLLSSYKLARVPMKPFNEPEYYIEKIKSLTYTYRTEKDPVMKHYHLRELDWHRAMLKKRLAGSPPEMVVPLQLLLIENISAFAMLPFEMLTLTGNKVEAMMLRLGFSPEAIFVSGCANSTNGYLAPVEELPFGGYEVSGAAHWYGMPECGKESEPAVLECLASMAAELSLRSL